MGHLPQVPKPGAAPSSLLPLRLTPSLSTSPSKWTPSPSQETDVSQSSFLSTWNTLPHCVFPISSCSSIRGQLGWQLPLAASPPSLLCAHSSHAHLQRSPCYTEFHVAPPLPVCPQWTNFSSFTHQRLTGPLPCARYHLRLGSKPDKSPTLVDFSEK